MPSVRESLLQIAQAVSPESTWDHVMEQIYVRQKIEAGLADLEDKRIFDHDALLHDALLKEVSQCDRSDGQARS